MTLEDGIENVSSAAGAFGSHRYCSNPDKSVPVTRLRSAAARVLLSSDVCFSSSINANLKAASAAMRLVSLQHSASTVTFSGSSAETISRTVSKSASVRLNSHIDASFLNRLAEPIEYFRHIPQATPTRSAVEYQTDFMSLLHDDVLLEDSIIFCRRPFEDFNNCSHFVDQLLIFG